MKTVAEATYEALALWRYILKARLTDIVSSADFIAGIAIGVLSAIAAGYVHPGLKPHIFTMIVSTFAILGGFLGTSLSVLIGFISKPLGRANRLQYLNVIADYCFSVAVVMGAALLWIAYGIFSSTVLSRCNALHVLLRSGLIIYSAYAALIPFSGLQRLFRLAGMATIADEKDASQGPG